MAKKDYRNLLSQRVEKELSRWRETGSVEERELYRFLHMMKGTAGTIGMSELSEYCEQQMIDLSDDSRKKIPLYSLMHIISSIQGYFSSETAATMEQELVRVESTVVGEFDGGVSFAIVIDDDVEYGSYIREMLEEDSIQVVIATHGKKGLELIYTLQPQIIIVNKELPDISGFELIEQMGAYARSRLIPVLMTGRNFDNDTHVSALNHGATDVLDKATERSLFLAIIHNRLRHNKEIREFVLKDALTGAGNRRNFDEVLKRYADESSEEGFILVLLDLDHFKNVNDDYGHLTGDHVLRIFSELVMEKKQKENQFFRYGGEEFALLVKGPSSRNVDELLEDLRKSLLGMHFTSCDGETFQVTFSAGIAPYSGDANLLISQADKALYMAKENGRNQVKVYDQFTPRQERKLNLILIDDDVLVRKMLIRQFTGWQPEGLKVSIQEFVDGVSFLEADWYKQNEWYMILLDGVMPKMDGIEVLGQIRENYSEKNVVVSMLTGRTNETDIVLALQQGADDYIIKPFHSREVAARVQRLIGRLIG